MYFFPMLKLRNLQEYIGDSKEEWIKLYPGNESGPIIKDFLLLFFKSKTKSYNEDAKRMSVFSEVIL